MSAARTFETRLPEVLEELSNPRTPAYYDDILFQVARTRQRPGWTFIERWLPMTAISGRLATAPRVPMRIAMALLLLLLAFAITVLIAGTSHPTVPAPFGVAGNGQIVFTDSTGAISVGTLADGTSRVIVPGFQAGVLTRWPMAGLPAERQRRPRHRRVRTERRGTTSPECRGQRIADRSLRLGSRLERRDRRHGRRHPRV